MVNHNHFMGYTNDTNGQLQIVPEEDEIMRSIVRLYIIGHSCFYCKIPGTTWKKTNGVLR